MAKLVDVVGLYLDPPDNAVSLPGFTQAVWVECCLGGLCVVDGSGCLRLRLGVLIQAAASDVPARYPRGKVRDRDQRMMFAAYRCGLRGWSR